MGRYSAGTGSRLYAAFGSNLDPARMLQRCPHSPRAGVGWLNGWRLTFGGDELSWEGPIAMLVQQPGSRVFVALYELSPHDVASLDSWEGTDTGVHHTIHVRTSTLDGDILAFVYVLDGYEGGLPTARYLGMLADAAESGGAPEAYVAELRARPCRSVDL